MSQGSLQITLLHTNDMHSHLEAMSRLSTFARRQRADLEAEGRRVFFFDAGDAADRRMRFCGVTKGAAFPRILKSMNYDLQTLGNAISITYGLQAASGMARRAAYPVLAANLFDGDLPLVEGFQPTMLYPLGGDVTLGVIGLTVHAPQLYALFGVQVPDYRDTARRWVEQFTRQGVRPIVVVSHLGIREDRLLAEAVPEIDVILGGHSHTLLPEGEWVNGVLIAQTGNYAEGLGRVDLEINPQTGAVLSASATVLSIPADTPPDPAVDAAVREAEAEAAEFLKQPVGELKEPLDQDFFRECGIGNLAADALRERMDAGAALLTSGLFNADLPAGAVTLGALDGACFTTANPQVSALRGEQIVAALERGVESEMMNSVLKVFRGAPVGLPVVSGMTITYHPGAANGRRIEKILVQGQPLLPDRIYRVAHTDAEVHEKDSQYGYLELEPGQLLKTEVPTILREVIADYLKAHGPMSRPGGGRWQTD